MQVRLISILLLLFVAAPAFGQNLPGKLSNEEFWTLSAQMSEPDGTFRSDNLVSNERGYQDLIVNILPMVKPGGVYVGVGPEQNFAYIAALRPRMAFIIDIRRGNLNLQLLYKALFELSRDRAEFVSRLFSRKRPSGLGARSSVNDIFNAYIAAEPSEALYQKNVREIRDHLLKKRRFPLSAGDLEAIEEVFEAFFRFGPYIDYNSSSGGAAYRGQLASYADLMTAVDINGLARSFLGMEASFAFVRNLQMKNLIVPVVGNFAGPKAIRAVGEYLKRKDALVSVFYLSNVEQYLEVGNTWGTFCGNASSLPMDESSIFIRAVPHRVEGLVLTQGNMIADLSNGMVSCR
jgi:hypothetical protein